MNIKHINPPGVWGLGAYGTNIYCQWVGGVGKVDASKQQTKNRLKQAKDAEFKFHDEHESVCDM